MWDGVPYPRTYIDVSRATTVVLVTPNCSAIRSLAGAIMDDETGLMNV